MSDDLTMAGKSLAAIAADRRKTETEIARLRTKSALVDLLTHHIGADTGISAQALAQQLGTPERHLRMLVSELREDGIAVCGHPTTGYYVAATAEELEETCQFLRARAMHSLVIEARLRKIPLPDLLGQLRLRT